MNRERFFAVKFDGGPAVLDIDAMHFAPVVTSSAAYNVADRLNAGVDVPELFWRDCLPGPLLGKDGAR